MDFYHLIRAFILWRSALGLLTGKFRQYLTELSAHDMIIYLTKETSFVTSRLLSCARVPSEKGSTLKNKNLPPKRGKSFLLV